MTANATSKSPSSALLLGHSDARRTRLLREACARRELTLHVLDWNDFLAQPRRLAAQLQRQGPGWMKIDSPGENAACADTLRRLGWQSNGSEGAAPGPLAHGELAAQQHAYAGLAQALAWVDAELAQAPQPPQLLNGSAGILAMTDKWQCQQRLAARVAVPQALGLLSSFDAFEAQWPAQDAPRVFLKARYGSSAAGVIALQRTRDGRYSAITSARCDRDGRLFNHLRLSRYTRRADIAALVDALAAQGAYAERWVRKPRAPAPHAGHYDLRVVAHAGRARQRIARIAASPLTNLHLGNARAQPDWLEAESAQAIADTVATAAAVFGDCRSIGFDLIAHARGVHVIEANAFGDLLPGLRCDGRETYDDQAELMRHAA